MHELTPQNIEHISRDIGKQEITFSHLPDDLIDHVCCDIEYEMNNGLDFTDAYRKVKLKIGKHRLKEIQEETLYAIDTKYRVMKNTMKISGIIGTVLFGCAALFKIQHWPLAGTMLTLGAFTLAFIFMPSALGVLWKETHNRKRLFLFISAFLAGMFFILGTLFKVQHWPAAGILLLLAALFGVVFFMPSLLAYNLQDQENKAKKPVYILGAIGFVFYIAGMFFKVQHWPLASTLMVAGMIILCGLVFPWYTWVTWKEDDHISARFIYMVIGLLIVIVPGALINLNLQQSYETGYYSHQDQQKALYNYLYRNNNSIMTSCQDSLNYPLMEQVHSRTGGLLAFIGDVESKMISEAEGKPGAPVLISNQIVQTEAGPQIQYKNISRPFHPRPVMDFLLPGSKTREELTAMMSDYNNYLTSLVPAEVLQNYSGLLDPAKYLPGQVPEDELITMMTGLHSLVLLKNSILSVESEILKAVACNKLTK